MVIDQNWTVWYGTEGKGGVGCKFFFDEAKGVIIEELMTHIATRSDYRNVHVFSIYVVQKTHLVNFKLNRLQVLLRSAHLYSIVLISYMLMFWVV